MGDERKDQPIQLVASSRFMDRVEQWRRARPGAIPNRSEAIRELVEKGLAKPVLSSAFLTWTGRLQEPMSERIHLIASAEFRKRVDDWRRRQPGRIPSRSAAVRLLTEWGLGGKPAEAASKRGRRRNQFSKD